MLNASYLVRVGVGMAATVAEQSVAIPVDAVRRVAALPTVPVRLAGEAVRVYMRASQAVTGFAVKGDRILQAVLPEREAPEWATFDEDAPEVSPTVYGTGDDAVVPSGRVRRRS